MIKTFWLTLLLFGNIYLSQAQIFGGSPPSVKWNRVNTSGFRIIFPKGTDSTANKVASDIYYLSSPTLKTIGTKTKKIDIVLRNAGLISNGYVGLGPFRSEFYLTPPPNPFELGSTPWPDLLSAHEYRHVQQYNNFDVGLSRTLRILFGQGGQALANSASVPDWFFEGDAVYSETNVSRQGRGSLPYFYNGYRALWQRPKNYNWMKIRNGSYIDFVPDKYITGFMLTAYGREKFGMDFWKDVTHDAASFKSLFYPFQSAIKKHSGMKYKPFRDSAFAFFKNQFQDSGNITDPAKFYQNEKYASYDPAGNLVFLKSSVKSIPQFVKREKGKDKKIRTADYMIDDYFSYQNDKIIYTSRRYHPRWISKSYNEIQILDIKTGSQKTVTKRTRYFSPALNESGDKIIAVHSLTNGQVSLDMLDAGTGDVIKTYTYPELINFYYPKFSHESIVTAVANKEGKMSMAEIHIETGEISYLLPFSDNVIGFPLIRNDTLFFSISQKTNDELMAITLPNKKLWKIGAPHMSSIGKYHVAVSRDSFAWSTFTSQGLKLQTLPREQVNFEEISQNEMPLNTVSFGLFSINNINSNLLYRFFDTTFSTRKYNQLNRPIHFHSLIPGAEDPEYSLSLIGENILNTVQTDLSFTYNRSDGSKAASLEVLYGGLFPVFSFGYSFTMDRSAYSKDKDRLIYYNVSEPYAGFYIPLNFSARRNIRLLSFGSSARHSYRMIQHPFKNDFKNSSFFYLNNYLSFSNQIPTATAQVLPRFAQSVYLNYKAPLGNVKGYQYLITGKLFLPGIGTTHSLNFSASYSQKDTLNKIGFGNSFPFSRGYTAVNLHKMKGLQINYQLPLAYPDIGFANLAYLMRLRSNFFFDYTQIDAFTDKGEKWNRNFNSVGTELFFDTKWWNQVPVSFGFRYSRLLEKDLFGGSGSNRWEFIMPLNLFDR